MMDWASWQPKERATLCFVRDRERVLMIRKKRGLGGGKINGVGGRLEGGESPLQGILRETQEELGITLIDPVERGELRFQFLDGYSLFCTVFVASRFSGTPVETEEAAPLWFEIGQLPFNEMWEDDELWLPQALEGKSFRGFFVFDGERMVSQQLQWGEQKVRQGEAPSEPL
jgi:8-oxo-dGTP diphosphatase